MAATMRVLVLPPKLQRVDGTGERKRHLKDSNRE